MDHIQEFSYAVSYYDTMAALEAWSPSLKDINIKKIFKTISGAIVKFIQHALTVIGNMIGTARRVITNRFGKKQKVSSKGTTAQASSSGNNTEKEETAKASGITDDELKALKRIVRLANDAADLIADEGSNWTFMDKKFSSIKHPSAIDETEREVEHLTTIAIEYTNELRGAYNSAKERMPSAHATADRHDVPAADLKNFVNRFEDSKQRLTLGKRDLELCLNTRDAESLGVSARNSVSLRDRKSVV